MQLNLQQKEAVEHSQGPLLIIAGAGAGKTKTVTHRITNLITNGAAPENILAVTFTNKAAKEMRERVTEALRKNEQLNFPGHFVGTPQVSTFHSLGVKIIRENADILGLKKRFTIFDKTDSIRTIKTAENELGFDPKEIEPKKVLGIISEQKGSGVEMEEYREQHGEGFLEKTTAQIWEHYEKTLKEENALDFDDLLLKTKKLLKEYPKIRECYQDRWHYIHIDEYQDTNLIQDKISELLAEKHKNICVVGDVDQNIFSWRGANIANLLQFEKRYPELKTVFLEENYRSTETIISASNEIISKNSKRIEKNMSTSNKGGEPIGVYAADNEKAEAGFIANKVKQLIKEGVSPSEIAVLYRTNFQSRALEESFMMHEIPYQVLGTKFFDRKEIKDALAFLRLAFNPTGVNDLKRAASAVPCGLGKSTILKMVNKEEENLTPALSKKVALFREKIENIRKTAETQAPSTTIKYLLRESGMEEHYSAEDDDSKERLANLKELVTLAKNYDHLETSEGIESFLENSALSADQDEMEEESEAVRLMTAHAAKGLEFDYVFVAGMEQNLFPHGGLSSTEERDEEEERRLFYVALTRARKKVFLSYALIRTIYGSREQHIPSEFLSDISQHFLEWAGEEEIR